MWSVVVVVGDASAIALTSASTVVLLATWRNTPKPAPSLKSPSSFPALSLAKVQAECPGGGFVKKWTQTAGLKWVPTSHARSPRRHCVMPSVINTNQATLPTGRTAKWRTPSSFRGRTWLPTCINVENPILEKV